MVVGVSGERNVEEFDDTAADEGLWRNQYCTIPMTLPVCRHCSIKTAALGIDCSRWTMVALRR